MRRYCKKKKLNERITYFSRVSNDITSRKRIRQVCENILE